MTEPTERNDNDRLRTPIDRLFDDWCADHALTLENVGSRQATQESFDVALTDLFKQVKEFTEAPHAAGDVRICRCGDHLENDDEKRWGLCITDAMILADELNPPASTELAALGTIVERLRMESADLYNPKTPGIGLSEEGIFQNGEAYGRAAAATLIEAALANDAPHPDDWDKAANEWVKEQDRLEGATPTTDSGEGK